MKGFSAADYVNSLGLATDEERQTLAYLCEGLLTSNFYSPARAMILDILNAAIDSMNSMYSFYGEYSALTTKTFLNFPNIDISVTDNCNLNCYGCNHFASIVTDRVVPPMADLEASMELFASKFPYKANTVNLIGGEPLLRDDLPDIIRMAASIMPDQRISVYTNLLLYEKRRDSIIKALLDTGTRLIYSEYPGVNQDQIGMAIEDSDKYGFKLICGHHVDDEFNRYRLCNSKDSIRLINILSCNTNACLTLRGKYLYGCPFCAYSHYLNQKFSTTFTPSQFDRIDLNAVEYPEEILAYMNLPKPFCLYCVKDADTSEPYTWKRSSGQMEEWIINSIPNKVPDGAFIIPLA